ncbi:MAG: hypothetical protein ACRC80_12265 [Waterburya sp.]
MDVTKKFTNSIIKGFEGEPVANKVALGLTSPLWFTGLVVSATLEGVFDVGKGAVDAVGNISGTVGDCTFKKLKHLEKMKASLNSKGAEIMVKFQKENLKFDAAVDLIKSKTLSKDQEDTLLQNMAIAIANTQ